MRRGSGEQAEAAEAVGARLDDRSSRKAIHRLGASGAAGESADHDGTIAEALEDLDGDIGRVGRVGSERHAATFHRRGAHGADDDLDDVDAGGAELVPQALGEDAAERLRRVVDRRRRRPGEPGHRADEHDATPPAAGHRRTVVTTQLHATGGVEPHDRGEAIEVTVGPQGTDYALQVRFDKIPWGEQCKSRCAATTVLLDTDDSPTTGLQPLDKKATETGADLAVSIEGKREYVDREAQSKLVVKLRQLTSGHRSVEEGDLVLEMDHQRDSERREQPSGQAATADETANDKSAPRTARDSTLGMDRIDLVM